MVYPLTDFSILLHCPSSNQRSHHTFKDKSVPHISSNSENNWGQSKINSLLGSVPNHQINFTLTAITAAGNLYDPNYTNPKKLLYESPHPGLLPLEKVTMRTYWDWYYCIFCNTGIVKQHCSAASYFFFTTLVAGFKLISSMTICARELMT